MVLQTVDPNQHPQEEIVPESTVKSSPKAEVVLQSANRYFVENNLVAAHEAEIAMQGQAAVEQTAELYPTVDLSAWIQPGGLEEDKQRVLDDIFKYATDDAGSFNITGHGVSAALLERLETTTGDFFNRPVQEKKAFTKGSNLAGYVGVREESNAAIYGSENGKANEDKDLREVYGAIYPPEMELNVKGPDAFQEAMDEYLHHMNRLDKLLHILFSKILAKAKGVELPDDYLESAKGGMLSLFRASHYPDVDEKYASANKLRAHSDWGSLSILSSSVVGLEEIRDGKWVLVPMRAGELHVVVAEMMHIWSNGLFRNNVHRVGTQATGQDRLSYVFFATDIKTREDEGAYPVCAKAENPVFGRISAVDHLDNYFKLFFGQGDE